MGKRNKVLRKLRHPKAKKEEVVQDIPIVICNDIEKLTFDKFLKCIVNNNLTVLIESGIPNQHQLFAAWIRILSEYYVLTKNKDQVKYIKVVAKMEALNLKIAFVTATVEALRMWYHIPLVESLKKWGYKLQFTTETLLADLDRVMIEISNDNFKLIKFKTDYDNEQKAKKKKGEVPSKESYMKILYAIEKHRQFRYLPNQLTVYEFCMFMNELIEYNEEMAKMNQSVSEDKYRKK